MSDDNPPEGVRLMPTRRGKGTHERRVRNLKALEAARLITYIRATAVVDERTGKRFYIVKEPTGFTVAIESRQIDSFVYGVASTYLRLTGKRIPDLVITYSK